MESIGKVKRSIVFIPSYYYLSHPLFFSIAEKFSGYEKVYLNPNDPSFQRYNKGNIKKEEILNYFNSYYEVDEEEMDYNNKNGDYGKLRRLLQKKRYIKSIEKVLSKIKPAAMISTSDMSYSARICNRWASRNNVPVIIIQPSFLDFEATYKKLRPPIRNLLINKIMNIPLRKQAIFGNENEKNYLFLWGRYFKDYYKGKPIHNNIYITGNPVFDKYFGRSKKGNDKLRQVLDIPSGKKVITICTLGQGVMSGINVFNRLTEIYRSVIEDNEKLYFIIKIHPREAMETYSEAFNDLDKCNYRIVKDIDLHDLYQITDVQVSISSYSSFEAVVLGIPIVLINPDNRLKLFDYFDSEIALSAHTAQELSAHLKRCLTDKYMEKFRTKRKKYLESRLDYLDGKSGERVLEKVEEIIGKK